MAKMAITDLDIRNKRVFMRVDFNVPIKNAKVGDDLRIRASLPTIQYAVGQGAITILASHLGRPKGGPDPAYSLAPVAKRLSELLGGEVKFVPACVGKIAEEAVANARSGDVLLLENVRFHKEDEANDPGFAKQLAGLAPFYVNDAFGS